MEHLPSKAVGILMLSPCQFGLVLRSLPRWRSWSSRLCCYENIQDTLQLHAVLNCHFINKIKACWCESVLMVSSKGYSGQWQKSKLGFYVPLKSKGHIGTGPQHLPLVGVKPTQRWQPVIGCQTCGLTRPLKTSLGNDKKHFDKILGFPLSVSKQEPTSVPQKNLAWT